MEVIVGGFGAIIFGVAPVEMMVVNEGAIKDDAVVWLERSRDDISGVGGCATVYRWAEATLGVSFDDESAKVRNGRVELIRFFVPPTCDARIKWIERIEAADGFRAAQVHGNRKLNAPRAKDVRDADELREEVVLKQAWVGVDIVDGAAVDADGSEETSVVGGPGEIDARVAVFKEDGTARIAAFDAAVEIVPLVHPADGGRGLL